MHTTYQFIMINIVVSEAITVPLPSTDNAKRFLVISLLSPFQFLRKLLENSPRHVQSSSSPPPHTTQNSPQSYIAGSEAITAPQPSTDNTKRSLTTRLLPPLQFLWKLLENSQRHIQSSSSPPPHLPKYTSIKHQNFGKNYGAAAIHRQRQMIPHHQAIANTPIIKKIA